MDIKKINVGKLSKDFKEVYDELKKSTANFDEDVVGLYKAEIDEFLSLVKDGVPEAIQPDKPKETKTTISGKPSNVSQLKKWLTQNIGNKIFTKDGFLKITKVQTQAFLTVDKDGKEHPFGFPKASDTSYSKTGFSLGNTEFAFLRKDAPKEAPKKRKPSSSTMRTLAKIKANADLKSQTKGRTDGDLSRDIQREAKTPGKRVTKHGTVYYENRPNRVDIDQRLRLKGGGEIPSEIPKKYHKYYKQAYNNPSQFDLKILESKDDELSKAIVWGVTDAQKDRANGTYKFKMEKGGSTYQGGGEVYIEFLNKNKGFKKDKKYFKSYDEAVKWAKDNFEKFDPDMISSVHAKGGSTGRGRDLRFQSNEEHEKRYAKKKNLNRLRYKKKSSLKTGGTIADAKDKWLKVMREFKAGELHSGSTGKVVTDKNQAFAIAWSEAQNINPLYGRYEDGGEVEPYRSILQESIDADFIDQEHPAHDEVLNALRNNNPKELKDLFEELEGAGFIPEEFTEGIFKSGGKVSDKSSYAGINQIEYVELTNGAKIKGEDLYSGLYIANNPSVISNPNQLALSFKNGGTLSSKSRYIPRSRVAKVVLEDEIEIPSELVMNGFWIWVTDRDRQLLREYYQSQDKMKSGGEVISYINKRNKLRKSNNPYKESFGSIKWEWGMLPMTKRKALAIEAGVNEKAAHTMAYDQQDWDDIMYGFNRQVIEGRQVEEYLRKCGIVKDKMKSGGEVFIETLGGNDFYRYKNAEIMHLKAMPDYGIAKDEYHVADRTFYSMDKAKAHIDKGSPMDERTKNAYRHGAFKNGGKITIDKSVWSAIDNEGSLKSKDGWEIIYYDEENGVKLFKVLDPDGMDWIGEYVPLQGAIQSYEDGKEYFKNGGAITIMSRVNFTHGRDNKKRKGYIIDDLGDGNYIVMSGFNQILVPGLKIISRK